MKHPNPMRKEITKGKKRRLHRKLVKVSSENIKVVALTPANLQELLIKIREGQALPAFLN